MKQLWCRCQCITVLCKIKYSNWLKQITWLAASNQNALFRWSIPVYATLKFTCEIVSRLCDKLIVHEEQLLMRQTFEMVVVNVTIASPSCHTYILFHHFFITLDTSTTSFPTLSSPHTAASPEYSRNYFLLRLSTNLSISRILLFPILTRSIRNVLICTRVATLHKISLSLLWGFLTVREANENGMMMIAWPLSKGFLLNISTRDKKSKFILRKLSNWSILTFAF